MEGKSEPQAPSIGIENRAKLEARLRSLEGQGDASNVRSGVSGRTQQKFTMTGQSKTYNTAADAVDLVPTQREPVETALQAALDVKAEKKRTKEEKKAKKKAKEEVSTNGDAEDVQMQVDTNGHADDEGKEKSTDRKEKKRKRRESEVDGATEQPVSIASVDGTLPKF